MTSSLSLPSHHYDLSFCWLSPSTSFLHHPPHPTSQSPLNHVIHPTWSHPSMLFHCCAVIAPSIPSLPPSVLLPSLHHDTMLARQPEAVICCHDAHYACMCARVCVWSWQRLLHRRCKGLIPAEREMNVEHVVKLDIKVMQPPVLLQSMKVCWGYRLCLVTFYTHN